MRSVGLVLATLVLFAGAECVVPAASARVPHASSAKAQGASACPLDRAAGQIEQVDGPADQVALLRAGHRLTPSAAFCIQYGDRLKAGADVLVRVVTAQGTREFGKSGEPVWAPESGAPVGSPGVIASVQQAFGSLFGRGSVRREYAVGRGFGRCRDDQYSGQPVAAVSRLPVVPQVVGSDLKTPAVGWKLGSAGSHISLTATDGAVVAEAQTCNATVAVLPLAEGWLRPGERLTLTVEDTQGGALRYPIEVVPPQRLASPAEPATGWLLGAWRLSRSDKAQRLDGLSRVAADANEAYAARRILDAVADGEL